MEHFLDRSKFGSILPNQTTQTGGNLQQPLLKWRLGAGRNHPRNHHTVVRPVAGDDAVAGALRTAIDTEHAHLTATAPPTPSRRYRSWSRRSARRRGLLAPPASAACRWRTCPPT